MSDGFIQSTSSEGLQMLGSAAQRSFELISGTVKAQLGEDAAAIFAEPIATSRGAATEWYAALPGRVVPLADLTKDERTALRQTLSAHLAAINALADRITARATSEDYWLAEALRNAVEAPDDTAIWALRSAEGPLRPLVVNWARLKDQRRDVRGVLTTLAPRKEVAAPIAPGGLASVGLAPASEPVLAATQAAAPVGWQPWPLLVAGWVMLAGMIALLTWLMVAPCGLQPDQLVSHCPAGPQTAATTLDQRHELLAQIAALNRRLSTQDQSCNLDSTAPVQKAEVAPAPISPPANQQAQGGANQAELDRRLSQKGLPPGADLLISLLWNSKTDLDLMLTCPDGEKVDFRQSQLAHCAAVLDVDANYPAVKAVSDPVENISVTGSQAGHYSVTVRKVNDQDPAGGTGFRLFIRQNGGAQQSFDGNLAKTGDIWTHDLEITAP